MKKILLHVCCGTCVIGLLDFFKEDEMLLFFYNPNIEPKEEYLKRLEGFKQIAHKFSIKSIEESYENDFWHEKVRGFENEPEGGERCKLCFEMRLKKTAEVAKTKGFDTLATALSVNAWKDVDFINAKGKEIAERNGLKFFDFGLNKEEMKKICYEEKELAKKHNIYRQKYCGCLYGLRDQK